MITDDGDSHHPDHLLKIKIKQVKKALFHVMQENTLRDLLKKIRSNKGARVTIKDAKLPILGMWLYTYLIALLAAHPEHEDSRKYGDNLRNDDLSVGQFFAGCGMSVAIFTFSVVVAAHVLIKFINVREELAYFLSALTNIVLLGGSFIIYSLKASNPYDSRDSLYDYYGDLEASANDESALIVKLKKLMRSGLDINPHITVSPMNFAPRFLSDRLFNDGDHMRFFSRSFESSKNSTSTQSNSGKSPFSTLLNKVVVFENTPCAKNLREGKESVFAEYVGN